MKRLVNVMEEAQGEGLVKFIGERITLFCANYIYTGKLVAIINNGCFNCAILQEAGIVYETGAFLEKNWQDMQRLPHDCYVMLQSIESFMVLK